MEENEQKQEQQKLCPIMSPRRPDIPSAMRCVQTACALWIDAPIKGQEGYMAAGCAHAMAPFIKDGYYVGVLRAKTSPAPKKKRARKKARTSG
jgi:hypothetical protein